MCDAEQCWYVVAETGDESAGKVEGMKGRKKMLRGGGSIAQGDREGQIATEAASMENDVTLDLLPVLEPNDSGLFSSAEWRDLEVPLLALPGSVPPASVRHKQCGL